jgi:hypothetical protein
MILGRLDLRGGQSAAGGDPGPGRPGSFGLDRGAAARKRSYLAGDALTTADIMAVFSLTTMRYFLPYDLGALIPRSSAYLQPHRRPPGLPAGDAKGRPGHDAPPDLSPTVDRAQSQCD